VEITIKRSGYMFGWLLVKEENFGDWGYRDPGAEAGG